MKGSNTRSTAKRHRDRGGRRFPRLRRGRRAFKEVVDASNGESLADDDSYHRAQSPTRPAAASPTSTSTSAGLIEQAGGTVDPQTAAVPDSGRHRTRAKRPRVASLIPGSEQLEIESSAATWQRRTRHRRRLGPARLAARRLRRRGRLAEFGKRAAGRRSTASTPAGIPGQVPPHKFKRTLEEAGIDLEQDRRLARRPRRLRRRHQQEQPRRRRGPDHQGLRAEANNTVRQHRPAAARQPHPGRHRDRRQGSRLLDSQRRTRPQAAGRRRQGRADRDRLRPARDLEGARPRCAQTLSDNSAYKEAVNALGGTPISGFVDGPAALQLARSAGAAFRERGLSTEAKPYLDKIGYVAERRRASADGRTRRS